MKRNRSSGNSGPIPFAQIQKNVKWHSSSRQEPGELCKSNLVGPMNQHVMYDIE